MKINKIYVACCSSDLPWTRACVGSIRFFYPDIDVVLVKDEWHGAFSTKEIEKTWNAGVLRVSAGSPLAKLEAWFLPRREQFLLVDSDVVFLGPVLRRLEEITADVVVCNEDEGADDLDRYYFDPNALAAFDPTYSYPGFRFNAGQIVATSGMFAREDFEHLVVWSNPPRVRHPQIFRGREQGVLNYFLAKQSQAGRIKLAATKFMIWREHEAARRLDLREVAAGRGGPLVLHWAGPKSGRLADQERSDIIRFFESFYYSRVRWGRWRRMARRWGECVAQPIWQ